MHKIAAAAAGGLLAALALVGCSSGGGSTPASSEQPVAVATAAVAADDATLPPVDPQLVAACRQVDDAAYKLAHPDPVTGTTESPARISFFRATDDLIAAGIKVPGFIGITDDGQPGVPVDPEAFHRAVSMMQRYCTDRGYRG